MSKSIILVIFATAIIFLAITYNASARVIYSYDSNGNETQTHYPNPNPAEMMRESGKKTLDSVE